MAFNEQNTVEHFDYNKQKSVAMQTPKSLMVML